MASGSSADGPDGSDLDAPSDEGATSRLQSDQPTPDPPGESVVNPARWANWLRITAIVLSGIWIVTIPFMFWRAARFTWLPYLGVATVLIVALALAVGSEGEQSAPTTSASVPAATAAPRASAQTTSASLPAATAPPPTPVRTATATPSPTPPITPTQQPSFEIAHTDEAGVAVRDACDDERRVSAPGAGIAEGTVVELVKLGEGDCAEWIQVRVADGRESWVRSQYLEPRSAPTAPAHTPAPTPTAPATRTPSAAPTPTVAPRPVATARQMTVLDRECLLWGQATGNASFSEAYVLSNYELWQSAVLPGCRTLRSAARELCSIIPNPPIEA